MRTLKLVCAAAFIGLLAACQTVETKPVTAAQTEAQVSGVWEGHAVGPSGGKSPIVMRLSGEGGKITGDYDAPQSRIDTNPSVSGEYSGNKVTLVSSSGFTMNFDMSIDADNNYWMRGKFTGPAEGTASLKKK